MYSECRQYKPLRIIQFNEMQLKRIVIMELHIIRKTCIGTAAETLLLNQ